MQNGNQIATATEQAVAELQTRFLHPFIFDRRRFQDAGQALITAMIGEHRIWEGLRPRTEYVSDFQEALVTALFPGTTPLESGFFRVPERPASGWFKDALVQLPHGPCLPVMIPEGGAVELFLTSQGTGVLSLPLTPGRRDLTLSETLLFNHHIAQGRTGAVAELHAPHPADDQVKWAQMLVGARSLIKPKPDRFAPVEDRLGAPGGSFTLAELIAKLLFPLEAFALRPVMRGLSVYTVLRVRQDGLPPEPPGWLAALARVEEQANADSTGGAAVAELQPNHRMAAGPAGAAHWLEETGEVRPADAISRVARARDRFFIPYLAAYFQSLALNRAVTEAGAIAQAPPEQQTERLAGLRARLAQFGSGAQFQQISNDEAVQRAYALCQEGFKITSTWDDVRRVVTEVEGQQGLARQARAAEEAVAAAQSIAHIRRWTQWTGIFAFAILVTLWIYVLTNGTGAGRWLPLLLGVISVGAAYYWTQLRRPRAAPARAAEESA
jgi:hypothetical protein